MQKSVLWAEDLEGHRQPSLYYLSDEEGMDGPHLICDWNGSPTDFSEMEFDTLNFFKKHDSIQTEPEAPSDNITDEEFVDYPNPAADINKTDQTGETVTQTQRQNDLDFAECAHLDFLSVPPMTGGLIKRFVRNLYILKTKYQNVKVEKPQP
jgi:hypothetical protein